jgi:hypothetical protein
MLHAMNPLSYSACCEVILNSWRRLQSVWVRRKTCATQCKGNPQAEACATWFREPLDHDIQKK